jgi:serine/threonine protein kinase
MSFLELKTAANDLFKTGDYEAALVKYGEALLLCEAENDGDTGRFKDGSIILSNRSMTYLKLNRNQEALDDATRALVLDDRNAKAHFRVGKALQAMGREKEAKVALEISKKLTNSVIGGKKKPFFNDFKMDKLVGDGNFSKVHRAIHKPSEEVFALKVINRKEADKMKRRHPNIYNEIQMEKQALNKLGHPSVVRLHHTFSDAQALFFLMDFTSKGEVWGQLVLRGKMTGMPLSQARFYAAELINAMEHIHSRGIVHRDLKPENFILTESGHLQVIDFGTAKDLVDTKLNGPEFVGTAEYMSPEAVNSKPVSNIRNYETRDQLISSPPHLLISVFPFPQVGVEGDLWAMGCVFYQLLGGFSPFKAPSQYLSFLRIQKAKYLHMPHMPAELTVCCTRFAARALLLALCCTRFAARALSHMRCCCACALSLLLSPPLSSSPLANYFLISCTPLSGSS